MSASVLSATILQESRKSDSLHSFVKDGTSRNEGDVALSGGVLRLGRYAS